MCEIIEIFSYLQSLKALIKFYKIEAFYNNNTILLIFKFMQWCSDGLKRENKAI